MTSHIPVVHTVSGSLMGGIHPLAVLAYFEGANSPWLRRKKSNLHIQVMSLVSYR